MDQSTPSICAPLPKLEHLRTVRLRSELGDHHLEPRSEAVPEAGEGLVESGSAVADEIAELPEDESVGACERHWYSQKALAAERRRYARPETPSETLAKRMDRDSPSP